MNNKKYKKCFKVVCEAPINAPKDAFNLHDWVHNIEETPLFAENLYKKTFSE